MVLADGEDVEPELLGELGLLDELAQALLGADGGVDVREGGDSEFHGLILAKIVARAIS